MNFSIEEELWFGESSDDEAERTAGASMTARAAKILDLRPFPASAQRLIALAADEDSSVAEMQHVIETDPALATRLLRMVNSAAFALRARCTSVQHAIVLLGRRALSELGVAMAVIDMFRDGGDRQRRWLRQHSSGVAGIARQLALHLGLPSADLLTIGLLHDVGKLLELQMGTDDYPVLLEEAGGQRDTVHVLERKRRGYDHAVLAGHILRAWQIPDPVPVVVAWHHQASRAFKAGGTVAQQTMLVRLADQLSYAFLENTEPDECLIGRVAADEAAGFLGLSAKRLEEIWTELLAVSQESQKILA